MAYPIIVKKSPVGGTGIVWPALEYAFEVIGEVKDV